MYFHSGSEATYRKISEKPSSFTSIPTIDLADLDSPSLEARKAIARNVYDACHNCGFFYIENHGVPEAVLSETFALLQRFFALDLATKMDAHVQKNPAIRGYEPMLETRLDPTTKGGMYVCVCPVHQSRTVFLETSNALFRLLTDPPIRRLSDIKEAFTMGDCAMEPEQDYVGKTGHAPPSHITQPQNIWPSQAPWWRQGLYKYYNSVLPLALKLVRIFALAFDLEETALDGLFTFPITGMRPLYYPPMPVDEDGPSIGLGAHSDFSCTFVHLDDYLYILTFARKGKKLTGSLFLITGLTLVLQLGDVPALEVLNQDGIWVSAPPKPGSFVCNVGQYLERQTNGTFPATVHRVRNLTGQARYSLPFFLTPDPEAEMDVLACCWEETAGGGEGVKEKKAKKYDKINVGDLYIRRVLPARRKHPTSIKYREVPQEEWKYEMLLS